MAVFTIFWCAYHGNSTSPSSNPWCVYGEYLDERDACEVVQLNIPMKEVAR